MAKTEGGAATAGDPKIDPATGDVKAATPNGAGRAALARATAPTRRPKLGDSILYVLGNKSPNAGDSRAAIVTFVHPQTDAQQDAGTNTVNLMWLMGKVTDPNPKNLIGGHPANTNSFAAGIEYSRSCQPVTWHWADDEI